MIDTINSLLQQDYQNYEIIIIDQSEQISPQKKELIIAGGSKVKLFHISERGRSLAKNYGILQAKGDIILFCDDDILVNPDFIRSHIETYNINPHIGAVSCRLVEENDPELCVTKPLNDTFYGKLINKPYSTCSQYVTSLNGGNMSFKKEVINKIGFFEEFFLGTSMVEEPDMAYRVIKNGYLIYFNAGTTVKHFPQFNGNIAYMKQKRSEWFYFFFYNLLVYFRKYNRIWNLPFVFVYINLVAIKHIIIYRISPINYFKMLNGYFNGMKKGKELSKENESNLYYTPFRLHKKNITPFVL